MGCIGGKCVHNVSVETLGAAQILDTNGVCVFSALADVVNETVLFFFPVFFFFSSSDIQSMVMHMSIFAVHLCFSVRAH